jgi:hypothetical protein
MVKMKGSVDMNKTQSSFSLKKKSEAYEITMLSVCMSPTIKF